MVSSGVPVSPGAGESQLLGVLSRRILRQGGLSPVHQRLDDGDDDHDRGHDQSQREHRQDDPSDGRAAAVTAAPGIARQPPAAPADGLPPHIPSRRRTGSFYRKRHNPRRTCHSESFPAGYRQYASMPYGIPPSDILCYHSTRSEHSRQRRGAKCKGFLTFMSTASCPVFHRWTGGSFRSTGRRKHFLRRACLWDIIAKKRGA